MDAVPTHFFFHANCVNPRMESSVPGERVRHAQLAVLLAARRWILKCRRGTRSFVSCSHSRIVGDREPRSQRLCQGRTTSAAERSQSLDTDCASGTPREWERLLLSAYIWWLLRQNLLSPAMFLCLHLPRDFLELFSIQPFPT
jgi:hypothetical protein